MNVKVKGNAQKVAMFDKIARFNERFADFLPKVKKNVLNYRMPIELYKKLTWARFKIEDFTLEEKKQILILVRRDMNILLKSTDKLVNVQGEILKAELRKFVD